MLARSLLYLWVTTSLCPRFFYYFYHPLILTAVVLLVFVDVFPK